MNRSRLAFLASIVVIATAGNAFSAEQNWAGEYSDKNFLGGKAVFQLSIEQSGSAIQVSFDAVQNDGQGAAPEATGQAKATKTGLEFKWQDNFNNSGTGTLTRAGEDVVVSLKTTRVVDPRCTAFYKSNIRLKRAKK